MTSTDLLNQHLRVIYACEKGATGVYWGHRVVAAVFFRDLIAPLSEMHAHEMEHFARFGEILKARGARRVSFPLLWCAGGIAYGVLVALFGRQSVWTSTVTIEAIVERELMAAATVFKEADPQAYEHIHTILLDELAHKNGAELSLVGKPVAFVVGFAKVSASVAKRLAQVL